MATKTIAVIDIDEPIDVSSLIDGLESALDPVILRRRGLEVAIITPLAHGRSGGAPLPKKVITDEDRAASRAALGGWAGNVDVDRLRRAFRESRALPSRPPVKLDL